MRKKIVFYASHPNRAELKTLHGMASGQTDASVLFIRRRNQRRRNNKLTDRGKSSRNIAEGVHVLQPILRPLIFCVLGRQELIRDEFDTFLGLKLLHLMHTVRILLKHICTGTFVALAVF
jgi:hypothetical protein